MEAGGNQTSPAELTQSRSSDPETDLGAGRSVGAIKFAELMRQVEVAAREWGIHPHHPEGKFVSALLGVVGWFGQVNEAALHEYRRMFAEGRAAADAELERAKETTRAAQVALKQVRTAIIQEEVVREQLVVRMIDKTLPMFAERLQKCLFIKEWVVNTDIRRRRFFLAGCITLSVFLGGYVLRAVNEPGPSQAETVGTYCLSKAFPSGGHSYCLMDAFMTKSQ